MRELPTSTVTFLFTDVEGSTRLLAEHGDGYAELLAEHRSVLREAFARHGGVEVDTQGDAFFVAFARASDAVAAAQESQAALAATPIRVRIGIHTGEPQVTAEGYVGMDVHRAARIAAAGHGGQVLVSEQAAQLLDGAALRDLGRHRLKDVGEARVYQLGGGDFPPLKTLYQTNLPAPANPLVGRKKELIGVVRLLAIERVRVVTLTGPGGTGKTRFSLAAAAEVTDAFADGVWFVDVSPVRDPALVLATIAAALGARVELPEHIGDRELLLVLDNLEQVVEAAAELAGLVAACPGLQLLVTSREPLRIAAEQTYALRPLPESPAVELFRQRARAAAADGEVDYELAAAICDRVDRLPLAIELAAARVGVLDPPALLERLERRLPVLSSRSRDLPERQRTLHSTIAWSHELLSEAEQPLFARLAVFAGGCTLAAAEAVCEADLDVLESLVEKSLLRRRGDRYVMLETIREYAAERLEDSGDGDGLRRRLAEYLLDLALAANLSALADGPMDHTIVEPELENARAALDWALDTGAFELGLRLAIALEQVWAIRSPGEGHARVRALLDRAGGEIEGQLLADALRACASCVYLVGEYALGTEYVERSLAEYRAIGDEAGIGHMLMRLGAEATRVGDHERATALARESLERCATAGYRRGEPQALMVLANIELGEGRPEAALGLFRESVRLSREVGFRWWEGSMLGAVAELELALGRLEDAARSARDCLRVARQLGDRQNSVWSIAALAAAAGRQGDAERAGRLWGAVEAEEGRSRVGQWEDFRGDFEAQVLTAAGEEFERARAAGRLLTLDDAAQEALGDE
ncbi:MAG: adenylate/guanylate cyclase domain-containing protein [Gaiellaceae bacterium]